jgi:hypothetical protein
MRASLRAGGAFARHTASEHLPEPMLTVANVPELRQPPGALVLGVEIGAWIPVTPAFAGDSVDGRVGLCDIGDEQTRPAAASRYCTPG